MSAVRFSLPLNHDLQGDFLNFTVLLKAETVLGQEYLLMEPWFQHADDSSVGRHQAKTIGIPR
jgi:hypothetical protein